MIVFNDELNFLLSYDTVCVNFRTNQVIHPNARYAIVNLYTNT